MGEVARDQSARDGNDRRDAERGRDTREKWCPGSGPTSDRWTGQPYRALVWMQGHNYANFADPRIQPMLLRGIAWQGSVPWTR